MKTSVRRNRIIRKGLCHGSLPNHIKVAVSIMKTIVLTNEGTGRFIFVILNGTGLADIFVNGSLEAGNTVFGVSACTKIVIFHLGPNTFFAAPES